MNLFQYYVLSYTETGNMDWTVTEWNQHSSAFSVKSKKRQVRPLCTEILQSHPKRKNNTGASMHIAHRDFLFYFHLPLTRWQPASRLQGTSAQINQSRLKKNKKQNMSLWHTETVRGFCFTGGVCAGASFPALVCLDLNRKRAAAFTLTSLALNRMGKSRSICSA